MTSINDTLYIADDTLAIMMAKYKPLIKRSDVHLVEHMFEIQESDPRTQAYQWAPVLAREVNAVLVTEIDGFFRFGAPVFFKPSIAEVCAQLQYRVGSLDAEGITHYSTDVSEVGFFSDNSSTYHTAPIKLWREVK